METGLTPAPMSTEKVKQLGSLTLAFIGDAVFSAFVRKYLVHKNDRSVHKLTLMSNHYVNAESQAIMVLGLMDELSETETDFVRKGRNTQSHVPKNAKVTDYRYATGFETLLGYLELTGQNERLRHIMYKSICILDEKINI